MSFARFCILLVALHGAAAAAFDFDDVAAQSRSSQARQAYRSPSRKPPAELQALTYDQYRDIRFRPDHALWRAEKLPFELMFFHLGKFQTEPVRINEVTPAGRAPHPLPQRRLRLTARTSCRRRAGAISASPAFARTTR